MQGAIHRRNKGLFRAALGLLAVLLFPTAGAAATPQGVTDDGLSSRLQGLPPLIDGRTWIVQGTKLANGACGYRYPTKAAAIPTAGWEVRSIAIDMKTCRKLMEEGTPTSFATDGAGVASVMSVVDDGSATSTQALTTSTKDAWQRVIWRDLPGLLLNADLTQITWNYNGSTVSGGVTVGGWSWNTATQWQLTAHSGSDSYGPGSSYYFGRTTSTFSNTFFCGGNLVRTFYYNNDMWGHPNGTATRSQNSDTLNECLPVHIDIQSAYGKWPG